MLKSFFKNPKKLIVIGVLLFVIAFLLSLHTMYYSSPHYELKKKINVSIKKGKLEVLNFIFPRDIGERLYYDIDLKGIKKFSIVLEFYDNDGYILYSKNFTSSETYIREKGSVLFYRSPYSLKVLLHCLNNTKISGIFVIRYSIIDITTLAIFSISSAVLSLIGMGILAFGVYGYLIEKEFERRKKRGKNI